VQRICESSSVPRHCESVTKRIRSRLPSANHLLTVRGNKVWNSAASSDLKVIETLSLKGRNLSFRDRSSSLLQGGAGNQASREVACLAVTII